VTRLERGEIKPRITTVVASEMCFRDEAAKVGVTSGRFGEERHVAAVEQRQVGSGDGLDSELFGGLSKGHGTVNAVVIGERKGRIPHVVCGMGEVFGERGPVQKGESGMTVQFDVHGSDDARQARR